MCHFQTNYLSILKRQFDHSDRRLMPVPASTAPPPLVGILLIYPYTFPEMHKVFQRFY